MMKNPTNEQMKLPKALLTNFTCKKQLKKMIIDFNFKRRKESNSLWGKELQGTI